MRKVYVWMFSGFLAVMHPFGSVSYAGKTEVISVDSAGKLGNGMSNDPSISAAGRYVAFESTASNLVPGDTNGYADIFVHDRKTGETKIISKDSSGKPANGPSEHSRISADGRYVAFKSTASNLVPGDTNGASDIFVHDRVTGKTIIISMDSSGKSANGRSSNPAISADGRYVAFDSTAGNLVPSATNGKSHIFVHDRKTGKTKIISTDSAGNIGNNNGNRPSISADGRYVAFESTASNLVPVETNGKTHIFVHDRSTGKTKTISMDSSGKLGNNDSNRPSISADGRYVAFDSDASNLVTGDTNEAPNVFVHDCVTAETKIIDKDFAGKVGNNRGSSDAAISSDGRYVVYESQADNLVPGDTNGKSDAFIHDRQTGETKIISVNSKGTQGNAGGCFASAISADGRYVAFSSEASNLVPDDMNGERDIFVHDCR